MNTISVSESIRFGWETLKKRPLMIVGAFLLAMAVSGVSSALLDPAEDAPMTFATTMMGIVSGIIGIFVELGLTTFSLRAHDGVEKVSLKDLWNPGPFLYYLIGQILVGLSVLLGLILLIVPGVLVALTFLFTSYLIVDKGLGPIEAMKESMRLSKGHRWELFLLVLAIIGLNILGLLALVVGLLVTIPISMLAIVHAYRKISRAAPATPPFAA